MAIRIVVASYTAVLKDMLKNGITGSGIEIVTTYNIVEAAANFRNNEPNVLILDLDSGTSATHYLGTLMKKYSLFTILTGSDNKQALDFFKLGVRDFLIKPKNYQSQEAKDYLSSVYEKSKEFIKKSSYNPKTNTFNFSGFGTPLPFTDKLIAIAASTGGPDALYKLLTSLPKEMPPILVVQHMPSNFTKQFAQRLDNFCKLTVKEAEPIDYIEKNTVYIAPGDFHMILVQRGGRLAVETRTGSKVHGVRPAADVLFNTVAEIMKDKAIGVVLTGMGDDGARGLYLMRKNGARTIGQDKDSCVVYGMPMVAYKLGAVEKQLPLNEIAGYLQMLV